MSRFISNAKLLVSSVAANGLSLSVTRRGYAAASQGSVVGSYGRGGSTVGVMERRAAIKGVSEASSSSWALDPSKGYYRPQNCGPEIDPVELRELLLKNKVRPH